jgi:hypothetical protein
MRLRRLGKTPGLLPFLVDLRDSAGFVPEELFALPCVYETGVDVSRSPVAPMRPWHLQLECCSPDSGSPSLQENGTGGNASPAASRSSRICKGLHRGRKAV